MRIALFEPEIAGNVGAILRLGAYELEYEPEVPYRVVINEAVELAWVPV